MGFCFETLGNATIQIFKDQQPILATDPWLIGKCYFGSWALDHPLNESQINNVINSDYIWISHGHPDHLHVESLALLPRGKKILLPDHYHPEIKEFLQNQGFDATTMPYKTWIPLADGLRITSLDNQNQDAMLIIEAGESLLINQNDSPLCGEGGFLRRLIRHHPHDKTYLFALCSIDADMLNFVDGSEKRVTLPPEKLKSGKIHEVSIRAARLGVKNFCCSSSQHIYVRQDSVWANEYRITWADMQTNWSRPQVNCIEPYVTVDLETGAVTRNHPTQSSDATQITDKTGDDDWNEKLDGQEWSSVESFILKFQLLSSEMDFVEFTVGAETKRIFTNERARKKPEGELRGVRFSVPKKSLLETVEYGFFDDLLIGNYMKTELKGIRLYPNFSPFVAKYGGNAKVFTKKEYNAFRVKYFKRSPFSYFRFQIDGYWRHTISPYLIELLTNLGIKDQVRRVFRMLKGVPS